MHLKQYAQTKIIIKRSRALNFTLVSFQARNSSVCKREECEERHGDYNQQKCENGEQNKFCASAKIKFRIVLEVCKRQKYEQHTICALRKRPTRSDILASIQAAPPLPRSHNRANPLRRS